MPKEIKEKPLMVKMDARKAHFKDGTEVEVDSVILCTGYNNYFPFLESRFRILEHTHLYPPGLYMGTLFYKAGNNNPFNIGVEDQFYTFHYFDALAVWTCRYIMGTMPGEPKSQKEMDTDSMSLVKRTEAVASEDEEVEFQTDLIDTLVEKAGYDQQLTKIKPLHLEWIRIRKETLGLANYRDHQVTSVFTGKLGLKQTPFMKNLDDSLEVFLNVK